MDVSFLLYEVPKRGSDVEEVISFEAWLSCGVIADINMNVMQDRLVYFDLFLHLACSSPTLLAEKALPLTPTCFVICDVFLGHRQHTEPSLFVS